MKKEDDPDTLQLMDENDKEWVEAWRKALLGENLKDGKRPF